MPTLKLSTSTKIDLNIDINIIQKPIPSIFNGVKCYRIYKFKLFNKKFVKFDYFNKKRHH